MKLPILLLLIGASFAATAQPAVKVCEDARGEKVYDNTGAGGKRCKPVGDKLSVIPPAVRAQKLPVAIGMSQDQVRNNWGKPAKINKLQSRAGITEQWIYPGGTLTFANGVLETIQN